MNILLIGGTGRISMAVSKELLKQGHTLYLLNRGNRNEALPGAVFLQADIEQEDTVRVLLGDLTFDAVADFIAFTPEQIQRDYRLFAGRTRQYIFVSSASAYQKPQKDYRITENTPLENPYWAYSRNKIACEEWLMEQYQKGNFPVTIVRPSHTYDERSVPVGLHGSHGSWQVVRRILAGKPVIIHGDGTSLWTMTHNSDFARGFVGLVGNPAAIGEAVQITSDESLTWNQIYETLAEVLGAELHAVHVSSDFLAACSPYDLQGSLLGDKSATVVFDNSKLKKLVPGFCAWKSLKEGMAEAVAFIMEHPELQTEDLEFDAWCDRVMEARNQALQWMNSVKQCNCSGTSIPGGGCEAKS